MTTLNPQHIVCGRGAPTTKHPANRAFQQLVNEHQLEYICAARGDKPVIATKLLKELAANGTSFVKFNKASGEWEDIGEVKSYEKVCQALRDSAPMLRRKLLLSSSPSSSSRSSVMLHGGADTVGKQQKKKKRKGSSPKSRSDHSKSTLKSRTKPRPSIPSRLSKRYTSSRPEGRRTLTATYLTTIIANNNNNNCASCVDSKLGDTTFSPRSNRWRQPSCHVVGANKTKYYTDDVNTKHRIHGVDEGSDWDNDSSNKENRPPVVVCL